MKRRLRLAIPLAFVLFLADCTTKELATELLEPAHIAHPVLGNFLRFTLAYNEGAAMGLPLPLGDNARWPLVAIGVLGVCAFLYYAFSAEFNGRARQIGFGLLIGGALGNLASRAFSPRGVVDFIDIGIGTHRFYLFNVADIGINLGAILLAVLIYRARPGDSSSQETMSPVRTGPPVST